MPPLEYEPDWITADRIEALEALTRVRHPEVPPLRNGRHAAGGPIAAMQRPDADDLEVVEWAELFARVSHEQAVVDGLAYAGRWTAVAAPGKAGKSALSIHLAVELAIGRDPIDGHPREPLGALYLDAEMGRVDVLERLEDRGLTPGDLGRLAYVDVVPKLDTVQGSARLLREVERLRPALVVIDGINGAVQGAENDDTTWRAFYEYTVAPLKHAGIAVYSNDNLGKDRTLGPRGSSVKLDKPDAVVQLERTDDGVKLKTTHRRTSAYPLELDLLATVDGDAVTFTRALGSWPAGTAEKAAELAAAGVPIDATRRQARALLRKAGRTPGRDDVLGAALRFRKLGNQSGNHAATRPGTSGGNQP